MLEGIVGFLVIYGFCAIIRDIRRIAIMYMEGMF